MKRLQAQELLILVVFMLVISTLPYSYIPAAYATNLTDVYVSDTTDLWWSGATEGNIDAEGYIVPPGDAVWNPAVLCWVAPNWNTMLNPPELKAKLFEEPSANWIWKAYQVTEGESYTGDIVFFKKLINIPTTAINIQAQLFIITADNAYYFYVNNPSWSGTPNGIANFVSGYDPTNFYYISDGVNNLGGGTNSVPYETAGNLYPLDAAVPSAEEYWASIEAWDITNLLQQGENWLQIIAINEHAPPQGVENNAAGLIYKVEVTYEIPPLSVSISPTTARIKIGEFVEFTSDVSGGVPPYIYQWYLDNNPVPEATSPTWTFTPETTGTYTVYLNVTDSLGNTAKSNEASVTVAPPLTVSISPMSASIVVGESVEFTSTVSGGYPPYSYQWYLGNNPVSGATSNTWVFTPTSEGIYYIYLKVTDAEGNVAQSETAKVTVLAVPVGGYSYTIQGHTTAKPITSYIALAAILACMFVAARRKASKKNS